MRNLNTITKYVKPFLKPVCLLWGAFICVVISFIFGKTGFIKLYNLEQEGKQLEKQIAIVKQQNDFLKSEIQLLSDPIDLNRLELEARKLGMAARDEVVVKIR